MQDERAVQPLTNTSENHACEGGRAQSSTRQAAGSGARKVYSQTNKNTALCATSVVSKTAQTRLPVDNRACDTFGKSRCIGDLAQPGEVSSSTRRNVSCTEHIFDRIEETPAGFVGDIVVGRHPFEPQREAVPNSFQQTA